VRANMVTSVLTTFTIIMLPAGSRRIRRSFPDEPARAVGELWLFPIYFLLHLTQNI
jgi:hypothetical protein